MSMLRVACYQKLDEKLFKIYKFLIKVPTLIASRCSPKSMILNVEKDVCTQRVTEWLAPLIRLNRTSNKDILDYLLNDQLYTLMLDELRQKYPGEIYEY